MVIDAGFCQEFIQNNEESIKIQNVEIIDYLSNLQNVVDCAHYSKSYNLKFFDKHKTKMATEISKCLNNIGSKKWFESCKETCQNIDLSKINGFVEGDFEFLIDAVNLFEKFFEYKESGNFISIKLRMFFKKFVIPRKLKGKKKKVFLRKLKQK